MLKILLPGLLFILLIGCGDNGKNYETKPVANETLIKEDTTQFIFVGMIGEKAGLYQYDFENKKPKKFWFSPSEQVVELSFSENRKAAFFLTARSYGKRGVFPFITRVKLYSIDLDSTKVKFITNIGGGMQVFTEWVDSNNFKVALNSIDIKVSEYINQRTFIFNRFGKVLLNEKKIYNFVKEGYPSLPKKSINLESSKLNGELKVVEKGEDKLLYLQKDSDDNLKFICKDNKKLRDVVWDYNSFDLIFSTADVTPGNETIYSKDPQTSSLYVYSIKEDSIDGKWDGGGYKNFFIQNDKLFFDTGFKENSRIIIFDLNNNSPVDSIKISGGCGLENIPELPDYSA